MSSGRLNCIKQCRSPNVEDISLIENREISRGQFLSHILEGVKQKKRNRFFEKFTMVRPPPQFQRLIAIGNRERYRLLTGKSSVLL